MGNNCDLIVDKPFASLCGDDFLLIQQYTCCKKGC